MLGSPDYQSSFTTQSLFTIKSSSFFESKLTVELWWIKWSLHKGRPWWEGQNCVRDFRGHWKSVRPSPLFCIRQHQLKRLVLTCMKEKDVKWIQSSKLQLCVIFSRATAGFLFCLYLLKISCSSAHDGYHRKKKSWQCRVIFLASPSRSPAGASVTVLLLCLEGGASDNWLQYDGATSPPCIASSFAAFNNAWQIISDPTFSSGLNSLLSYYILIWHGGRHRGGHGGRHRHQHWHQVSLPGLRIF